jgi:hypothetical protein
VRQDPVWTQRRRRSAHGTAGSPPASPFLHCGARTGGPSSSRISGEAQQQHQPPRRGGGRQEMEYRNKLVLAPMVRAVITTPNPHTLIHSSWESRNRVSVPGAPGEFNLNLASEALVRAGWMSSSFSLRVAGWAIAPYSKRSLGGILLEIRVSVDAGQRNHSTCDKCFLHTVIYSSLCQNWISITISLSRNWYSSLYGSLVISCWITEHLVLILHDSQLFLDNILDFLSHSCIRFPSASLHSCMLYLPYPVNDFCRALCLLGYWQLNMVLILHMEKK